MEYFALCGFETQSLTVGDDMSTVVNSPTIDTTVKRTGAASLNCTKGAASTCYGGIAWINPASPAPTQTRWYGRMYLRITTSVAALCDIFILGATYTTARAKIRLATDDTLELWSNTAKLGDSSAVLAKDTWYCIELYHNDTTDTCEARINQLPFSSGTSTSGTCTTAAFGLITSTTGAINIDDVAVSGIAWIGPGGVLHMRPNADITPAATGTFADIDDVAPDGDTTVVTLTSGTPLAEWGLQSHTDVGIGTNDIIKGLLLQGRYKFASTSNDSMALFLRDAQGVTHGNNELLGNTAYENIQDQAWLSRICIDGNFNGRRFTATELDSLSVGAELTVASPPTTTITALYVAVDFHSGSEIDIAGNIVVMKTGNDANGGTSSSIRSSGTDGVTVNNTTNTFTSATGTWSADDVGHGIAIGAERRRILAVNSATSLVYDGVAIANATGITWKIGGPWLTIGAANTYIKPGDDVIVGKGVWTERLTNAARRGSAGRPIHYKADHFGYITGIRGRVCITNNSNYLTGTPSRSTTEPMIDLFGGAIVEGFVFDEVANGNDEGIVEFANGTKWNQAKNNRFLNCFASSSTAGFDGAFVTKGEQCEFSGNFVEDLAANFDSSVHGVFQTITSAKYNQVRIYNNKLSGGNDTGGTAYLIYNNSINHGGSVFFYHNTCLIGGLIGYGHTNFGHIYILNNVLFRQGTFSTSNTFRTVTDNVFIGAAPNASNKGCGHGLGDAGFLNYGPGKSFLSEAPLYIDNDSPVIGAGTDTLPGMTIDADILGRPRPLYIGGDPTPGCFEYNAPHTVNSESKILGLYACELAGSALKIFEQGIWVPAGKSITVTCIAEYESTYNSNNDGLPMLELLENLFTGIDYVSDTHASAVNVEETLSVQSSVATADGYVFVRIRTKGTLTTALAFFDNFTVAIS